MDPAHAAVAAVAESEARFASGSDDSGTWLPFQNQVPPKIVFNGDPVRFNPCCIILVDPDYHPHVTAGRGGRR